MKLKIDRKEALELEEIRIRRYCYTIGLMELFDVTTHSEVLLYSMDNYSQDLQGNPL